jgi:hypothetical protein
VVESTREVDISSVDQAGAGVPAADRVMRRLLRIGDEVDSCALLGARRSTTAALAVSGIRCLITYIVIPVLAPFLGLLETIGAPLAIALSVFAIVMGVAGVRRFWLADHRARWAYTVFIGVVMVLLIVGIGTDLASIVT